MIKCKRQNCTTGKQAIYGYSTNYKAIRCYQCKTTDMVNVVHNKCQNCFQKFPGFGYLQNNKPIRCKECKTTDMIDVVNKTCEYLNCMNRATCGYPNSYATQCETCMANDMIILHSKETYKCEIEGCYNYKHYGYEKDKIKRRCYKCSRNTDMINVSHKKCNICQTKIPLFGYEYDTKATHCGDCKKENMINIKSPKCQDLNCTGKEATYGYPGFKPNRFAQHKLPNQKPNPKKKCTMCKEFATHGFKQALWCEDHAHENSTNLIEQECSSCHFLNIIRQDGMCEYCSDYTHYSRVRLGKQYDIEQYLKHNNIQWNLSDQKIPNSINALERPDFLFDYDDYAIVLEVDEHQHMERQCECEQKRMINITNTLQKPTLFIRYNPDYYKSPQKGKQISDNKRKETLLHVLHNLPDFMSNCSVGVMYLFFDDYTENDTQTYYSLFNVYT